MTSTEWDLRGLASINIRPEPLQPADYRTLAWIVAGAILLRAAWALAVPVIPLSDGLAYDVFARTLVEHGVFGWNKDDPLAFWPPGTTFLHAAVYKLFGLHYAGIVILNILLSVGIMVSTARIAARYYGRHVAHSAAAILAFWPTLIMYPTVFASELPYLFTTIAALDAWTSQRPGLATRAVIAGLLLGLGALIRPLALALPFIYGFCIFIHHGPNLSTLRSQALFTAMVALVMALVIAPWTLRNYQVLGAPVLIATNGGITLWMGNTPGTDGRHVEPPSEILNLPQAEQAEILRQRALKYIADDPVAFVLRAGRKMINLWGNESVGVGWNAKGIEQAFGEVLVTPLKRFTQLTWALIFLVMAFGTVALLLRLGFFATVFSPFVATIGFHSFVHSVMVAQERYHLAFAAQIAVLAGIGTMTIWKYWQRRSAPTTEAVPS